MKKTKFTESQIIGILKEQKAGKKVAEICRAHGIKLRCSTVIPDRPTSTLCYDRSIF